jgi:ubiquinone/menaquinone biosynthesis C-methylase UbiE
MEAGRVQTSSTSLGEVGPRKVGMIREWCFQTYWMLQRTLTPRLEYAQYLYEQILTREVTPGIIWLDLGCGHQLLPEWRAREEKALLLDKTIVGIDYDFPSLLKHQNLSLKVCGSISQLPFRKDSFDLVTANMVVEHLDDPETQFREIGRILKPGGRFIFHTPNRHGHFALMRRLTPRRAKNRLIHVLDGREPEDVFEVHYRANTKRKIEQLSESSGLHVVKIRMLVTDAVFKMIFPLAAVELIWIRALMTRPLEGLRTNIAAILQKPGTTSIAQGARPR